MPPIDTTDKRIYLKMAFVLDESSLHKLSKILQEHVLDEINETDVLGDAEEKQISYSVTFSDDSTKRFNCIDQILQQENSLKRHITEIQTSTPFGYKSPRATVTFRHDSTIPVSYDLKGTDKEVLSLSHKLDEYLSGLRPWYSWLARLDTLMAFIYLIISAQVLVYSYLGLAYIFPSLLPEGFSETNRETDLTLTGLGVLIMFTLFLLAIVANKGRKQLFPTASFAIGQSVQRYNQRAWIQRIVLTGVALPLVIGLLINILA